MTPRASRPNQHQRGFTAVEIAMVASVIAILALLILPIFRQRAEEARLAAAQDELQSLVKALLLLEADIPGGNHIVQLSDLNNLQAGPNINLALAPPDPSLPGRTRWFNDLVTPINSRFVLAGAGDGLYPVNTYVNTVAPAWKGPYIAMRNTLTLGQIATLFPQMTQAGGGPVNTTAFTDLYPIDPWGTPYMLFGPEGETIYNFRAVYSLGPDGLPAGQVERAIFGGGLPAGAYRRQGGLLGRGDDLEFRF
jgi:prepilin-type N-terminal cleavage/methylation domain-containing protein